MSLAPIIIFVYNRPEHTKRLLDSLAANPEAASSRIYIYSDGPKKEATPGALISVNAVRDLLHKEKRFPNLSVIESPFNLGLADSIIKGVSEVIDKYGKVIVLEDDLELSRGFLKYLNEALTLYEGEKKVMHISGYMFPVQRKLPETFFYKQTSCWGWATWADRWRYLERRPVKLLDLIVKKGKLKEADIDGTGQFVKQLKDNIEGRIKTWSVLWQFTVLLQDGLCLHPGKSLVRNTGLDNSGTHSTITKDFDVELVQSIKVKKVRVRDYAKVYTYLREFYRTEAVHRQNRIARVKDLFRKFVPHFLQKRLRQVRTSISEDDKKSLNALNRYTEADISFLGKTIRIADIASFQFMKKEIFDHEIYKFSSESSEPYIVDCGANIGLSIIYLKRLFPNAKVLAFEPDERIFKILKHNVEAFNLTNVELINRACWNSETTLKFYNEGADGGRVSKNFDVPTSEVTTIKLKDYLHQPVDFLKMDIEGAEFEVIEDMREVLKNVDRIFVEIHSFIGQEQRLPEILSILKTAGFRLYIYNPGGISVNPFIQLPSYLHMDSQLNVYGIR